MTANVRPDSRSARVSPQQKTGSSFAARAARTFFAQVSSVSPNRDRRSEWPTSTYLQPSSARNWGATSPVKAPLDSQWQFCPPTAMGEPRRTSGPRPG